MTGPSTSAWRGIGDPPAEKERKAAEAQDLLDRVNWVRRRRGDYRSLQAYSADMRRANQGWTEIHGPDGKGVSR